MTSKANKIASFTNKIPDGDDDERDVCDHCGFIDYQNPKIVVGSVATWEAKFLLCKRAIHPRKGYWTLPAGFLELNESAEDGAKREAFEEARANLTLKQVLAIYSVPHLSQIQIMYDAELVSPEISCGPESQEVMLVSWENIPWDDIAFPTVNWALHHWKERQPHSEYASFSNPSDPRFGQKIN